jgi:membrane-associated phospholipid phosphatase
MTDVQSTPAAEAAIDSSGLDRTARVLTEVLSPAHLVIAITFVSGLATDGSWLTRLGWALAASFFTGIVPYVVGLRAIAKGKLSSRHLPNRRERVRPMAWTLLSVLVGWTLLIVAHAPAEVLAVQAAMVTGAMVALAITTVWKISLHAGVAASAALCASALFGWGLAPVWLLVAAVGWSRVQLRDHTLAQVVAGTVIGTVAALPALLFL